MKQIQPVLLASVIGFLLFSAQAKADLLVVDSHSPKKVDAEKKLPSSTPSNLIIKDGYQDTVEQQSIKTLPAPVATQASRSEPAPIASTSANRQQGRLLMVGSPSPSPALKGWADDVPLSLALGQVVPSGFKVVKKDGFADDRLVSWKGGKSWNSVLSSLTFGYKFDAKIDWINQVVEIGPIGSIQASPVSAKEVATATVVDLPAVEAQRPAVVVARPPVVAPMPMVKSFATIPGRSLRENIEAWAEKESKNTGLTWTVVWEGADYPVVASATFNGDFNDPAGPIATIIAAYDDSDQPLIAELTLKDRVIHVKNRNYTPASVLLSSPSDLAPNVFVR